MKAKLSLASIFMKRMKILGILALSSIMIAGCSTTAPTTQPNKTASNNNVVSAESIFKSPLTELKEFTRETLKNKVLYIVNEGQDDPEFETDLYNLSQRENLDVVKILYDENFKAFLNEQGEVVKSIDYEFLNEIDSKVIALGEDEQASFFADLDDYIGRVQNNEDVTELTNKFISAYDFLSETEARKYLKENVTYEDIFINSSITEQDLPMILMFNSTEAERISPLPDEPFQKNWLLVQKGILDFNKTEVMKEAMASVESGKDTIISFGTTYCQYCATTNPLAKALAEELEIPFYDVNLNSVGNRNEVWTFLNDKNVMSDTVYNTPTIVYFKDGKEVNRNVGAADRTVLNTFFIESKDLKAPIIVKEQTLSSFEEVDIPTEEVVTITD